MTLGPATKAAIARLVGSLPYLHAEAAAVPTIHRSFWDGIKAKYAASHQTQTGSDPKVEAAQAHAEEEIAAALDADNKAETPAAPLEQPSTEPVLGSLPSDEPFHAPVVPAEPVPEPVVPLFPISTEAPTEATK